MVFGSDTKGLANGSWLTPTSSKFLNDCLPGFKKCEGFFPQRAAFLLHSASSVGPSPYLCLCPNIFLVIPEKTECGFLPSYVGSIYYSLP